MKNITNAYLVLSVADIRAMLHAAELEQKVRGETRESICVVLNNITVYTEGEDKKNPQISGCSVAGAVSRIIAEAAEDLAEHGSWTAQKMAAASTPMNHSDAAI